MYRTNFGIGHSMKDLLDAHIPPGRRFVHGHKSFYDTIKNSLHFQLGLALASLGVITSLVAQHMYSLPAYAFIAQDFTTQAALYTHHQYIAGFIMTRDFAHGVPIVGHYLLSIYSLVIKAQRSMISPCLTSREDKRPCIFFISPAFLFV
ncbi:hypothetical protein EJD97_015567 [Solanum chilense]|uniref:Uncharacterized protein n=1 Tax=Solanum chilense TaxID=4083 RepID=A0A6N2CD59_SOLCI|nr:hypothetical protein EJD97_015567 [Solanum chilense]